MKSKKKKHSILKFVIFTIIIIIIILLYARYVETKKIIINEYKITNEIITDNFNGFKIIHVSDIHYGSTTDKERLEKIVNKINELKPDLVLFTGDILNQYTQLSTDDVNDLINELNNINVSVGKYVVSGDNDNMDTWNNIIDKCNIVNLDNNYELIYNKGTIPILIAGIGNDEKIDNVIDNDENQDIYKILLTHKPDYIDLIDYSKFNLILAGHSMNGLMNIPGIKNWFLQEGSFKYYENYYKLNNTNLYISNGIGTSNIKFRLFNTPSINMYRLNNK